MAFLNNHNAAVKKLKALAFNSKIEVAAFREKIDETFYKMELPNHVDFGEHFYGGIACDVLSPEIYSSKKIIVYIHGGGFIGGSRKAWRSFCAGLSHNSYCRVVVPEISLAPENNFSKMLADVRNVFISLYEEEVVRCSLDSVEADELPEIIFAADSSGAAVLLAFLFSLEARLRQKISTVFLFSPWLNFSQSSAAMTVKKKSDEIMTAEILKKYVDFATQESALTANDFYISPALATADKLGMLPEIYIQMGEQELTLPDAQDFADKVNEAGGSCILEIVPKMIFMFQLADEFLWEAHEALLRIGKIISSTGAKHAAGIIENKPPLEKGIWADA